MNHPQKKPPLLTGFSKDGAGKGKALTSPTTSIWLAIIFVALIFAIGSVRRTVSKAEQEIRGKALRSGKIVEAPEREELRTPPPNPDFLFNRIEEPPAYQQENIQLDNTAEPIQLKPIDIDLKPEVPEEMRSPQTRTD